jgi:hypothetical protein
MEKMSCFFFTKNHPHSISTWKYNLFLWARYSIHSINKIMTHSPVAFSIFEWKMFSNNTKKKKKENSEILGNSYNFFSLLCFQYKRLLFNWNFSLRFNLVLKPNQQVRTMFLIKLMHNFIITKKIWNFVFQF